MKRVKDATALRALAASKGATVTDRGTVFNVAKEQFTIPKPVVAAPVIKKPPEKPVEKPDLVSPLLASIEQALWAQVEASKYLGQLEAIKPTKWKMDVTRNADGDLVSATISGL